MKKIFSTILAFTFLVGILSISNGTQVSAATRAITDDKGRTLEIPEVKDRYIVYQCIDVFTHNFYYLGTRGNNGDAGRFVFHNKHQQLPDSDATPVLMEGDHAIIVIRIDIKNEDEFERVRAIQDAIRIVDTPQEHRSYPAYDREKAFSPDFVETSPTLKVP